MTKKPFTTRVSEDALTRARAAVAGVQRIQGPEYTFSDFAQDALVREAERVEAKFNSGKRFPVQESLPTGPRAGGARGRGWQP